MTVRKRILFLYVIFVSLFLSGCSSKEKTLKIAATPVPHADILEAIKPDLQNRGINLKIVEVDDYNLPNRLLFEKQVDANFFQHSPYLEEQNKQFGYNLVPLASVHIEPMGIYSEKITSLDSLKEGALVAIPSDPSNESRALRLLEEVRLIKLKKVKNETLVTVRDISENPKNLKIEEVDSPFLPRTLADVDLAVIPANFAMQAKLNPLKNALALESPQSPYANLVVVRSEDLDKEDIQILKEALHSEKMKNYIREKYKGALIPAF